MIDPEENAIQPPRLPLTIKFNLAILTWYFEYFMKKYLPTFTAKVTSEFREAGKNQEVGGVPNSAHLYGLARDFVLMDTSGTMIPESQARKIFSEFIQPFWSGYSEFEPATPGHSYHVHVNLSRKISVYMGMVAVVVMGIVGVLTLRSIGKAAA